jgi:hypothetical protein
VAFVARGDAAKAKHPCREALDVPSTPMPAKGPTVLRLRLPPRVVRRDHLDVTLGELRIETLTVVSTIADQLRGQRFHESRVERVEVAHHSQSRRR